MTKANFTTLCSHDTLLVPSRPDLCSPNPCGDNSVCGVADNNVACSCEAGYEDTGEGDEFICTLIGGWLDAGCFLASRFVTSIPETPTW